MVVSNSTLGSPDCTVLLNPAFFTNIEGPLNTGCPHHLRRAWPDAFLLGKGTLPFFQAPAYRAIGFIALFSGVCPRLLEVPQPFHQLITTRRSPLSKLYYPVVSPVVH